MGASCFVGFGVLGVLCVWCIVFLVWVCVWVFLVGCFFVDFGLIFVVFFFKLFLLMNTIFFFLTGKLRFLCNKMIAEAESSWINLILFLIYFSQFT